MIRPLQAVNLVHQQMAAMLDRCRRRTELPMKSVFPNGGHPEPEYWDNPTVDDQSVTEKDQSRHDMICRPTFGASAPVLAATLTTSVRTWC